MSCCRCPRLALARENSHDFRQSSAYKQPRTHVRRELVMDDNRNARCVEEQTRCVQRSVWRALPTANSAKRGRTGHLMNPRIPNAPQQRHGCQMRHSSLFEAPRLTRSEIMVFIDWEHVRLVVVTVFSVGSYVQNLLIPRMKGQKNTFPRRGRALTAPEITPNNNVRPHPQVSGPSWHVLRCMYDKCRYQIASASSAAMDCFLVCL